MKVAIAVPVTLAMVYRAWSRNSLTPAGIAAALLTAIAHAVHPWNLPFALLIVFFLAGTRVTRIKHNIKAHLTIDASGVPGGEGPRTHVQVLANSIVASTLTLLHTYQLRNRSANSAASSACYSWPGDLLVVGIIAHYASVAADTFSSELGILSKTKPRLITSFRLREVPPGTNGGVTIGGLVAGLIGSFVVVMTAIPLIPFCNNYSSVAGFGPSRPWTLGGKLQFAVALTIWGALGSVLDSILGGWLQRTVVDKRSGRIVEGAGGKKVLLSKDPNAYHRSGVRAESKRSDNAQARSRPNERKSVDKGSRIVESGALSLLDNNEVNLLMATIMSLGAIAVASWGWDLPFQSIFS